MFYPGHYLWCHHSISAMKTCLSFKGSYREPEGEAVFEKLKCFAARVGVVVHG